MWGEKIVKIGDEQIHLKATMLAIKNISNRFGGLRLAANAIENIDLQATLYILAQGSSQSEQELEKWVQKHFFELFQIAAQYIVFLANGGNETQLHHNVIGQQEAVTQKEKLTQ